MSSLMAVRRRLGVRGPVRSTIGGNCNHQHQKEPANGTPSLRRVDTRTRRGDEQPPSIDNE